MAIRQILCRNEETGAEALIPETALEHMPAWKPVDEADQPADQPATAVSGDQPPPADPAAPDAGQTTEPPQGRTRKRQAADTATTEGE